MQKQPRTKRPVCLCLLACMAAVCLCGCGPNIKAYVAFKKDIYTQLKKTGTIAPHTYTVEKDGELAPLMQEINNCLIDQIGCTQECRQNVASFTIEKFLTPQAMTRPAYITYALEHIVVIRESYKDMITCIERTGNYYRLRIENLDISPAFKKAWLDANPADNLHATRSAKKVQQVFMDYTQAALDVLEFMKNKTDVCEVRDNVLVFEQKQDDKRYAALTKRLDKCRHQYYRLYKK